MSDNMRPAIPRYLWLGLLLLLMQPRGECAELFWEVCGEVIAVGNDEPRIVELRFSDGTTGRVPLSAFAKRSRMQILASTVSPKAVVEKPDEEGSLIVALEAAAAQARTAKEALYVIKLILADAEESATSELVTSVIEQWTARADRGEVRLGREWVLPTAADSAAKASTSIITEVMTMVRLGNSRLVKEYLEKASRADPSSGRADFLLGLATAFGIGQRADIDKAGRLFAEVVVREPLNGAAWNNLAICAASMRQFDDALSHFSKAADFLENPQVIASNVGLVVAGANNKRSKLTAKQTEGFGALYRRLMPEASGQAHASPSQASPTFLSPFGQPVSTQLNFADLFVPPVGIVLERSGMGVVVAPKVVLVSLTVVGPGGSVEVRLAEMPGGTAFPAEVIARSPSLGLALLRCEQLATDPVPLAGSVPAARSRALTVPGRSSNRIVLAMSEGEVLALDVLPGTFVHSATVPGNTTGLPIIDRTGRLIGLTASTPQFTQPGTPRAFGTSIERIWPFLKDHVPDLEPSESAASGADLAEIGRDILSRMVTVVAKPAP